MKSKTSSGGALLIVIIIVGVVAVMSIVGFVFWQSFVNNTKDAASETISSFEDCKKQSGSFKQEIYPERCITADGRTFTGPSDLLPAQNLLSYCAPAEKVCFDYPDDWVITVIPAVNSNGSQNGDDFTVTDPSGIASLSFRSAIDGLGGMCGPDGSTTYVLGATAIPGLTGFKTEFAGSSDQLYVTKMVTRNGADTFSAYIYVTGTTRYTQKEDITDIAGLCFSNFIAGRNAKIGSDTESIGAFSFGSFSNPFSVTGEAAATTYATADQAKKAFEIGTYTQAEAVLLSLRYQ